MDADKKKIWVSGQTIEVTDLIFILASVRLCSFAPLADGRCFGRLFTEATPIHI